MNFEEMLSRWTGPSSDTGQEKQERTERMVRETVKNHPGFQGCRLALYAKASYPNHTNVRIDSDVDIGVQIAVIPRAHRTTLSPDSTR